MNPAEVWDLYTKHQVLQHGHFVLSSGRHSDTYLQCARVLEHPHLAALLGKALAERFAGDEVDVVVSPAIGALLIGFAVAGALECRFLFTERSGDSMTLRRGQQIERGERAVVVEDVVTTGGSAAEVITLAERAGAKALGVGAMVDRSEAPQAFRLEALLRVEARSWDPADCPMCARGEQVSSPGSRRALRGASAGKKLP
jgi:orotate phosphoribosyltransferase